MTLIVCLLSDIELRCLGVSAKDYQSACDKNEIILYKYPIIEMAPPEDLQKFHSEVVEVIVSHIVG